MKDRYLRGILLRMKAELERDTSRHREKEDGGRQSSGTAAVAVDVEERNEDRDKIDDTAVLEFLKKASNQDDIQEKGMDKQQRWLEQEAKECQALASSRKV
ncbi:uncharacterized protein LOC111240899 [Vigna radiata var. radiata]|uniref:Uncharacterized protein LOC111240899 n=1 Tax=Vigna radiata var. radiata TaxID=3916 RepID=A0A3Q0EQY8_VIGRR|nr:uncharacterized protein LOC111240899 [Vigna radiata var. radiata]